MIDRQTIDILIRKIDALEKQVSFLSKLEIPASNIDPLPLGITAPGTSTRVSKSDHVHPMPTASGVGALPVTALSNTNPLGLGTTNPGVSTSVSRYDHVHPMPSATQVGAVPVTGGTFNGDIALNSDTAPMFARLVNVYAVPSDHFTSFSGWTWAGSPFTTPTTINTTAWASLVRIVDNSTTANNFAYYTGSDITAYAHVGLDSYVGVRVDDGTANNSVETRIQATTAGKNDIEYRVITGGVLASTTVYTDILPQWFIIRALRVSTVVAGLMAINTPEPITIGATGGISWTAARAGLTFGQRSVANSIDRAGYFDWARV
jgi:hypothetical protein